MVLDPLAVVGAIAAMGTLLLFIVRAFATGAIMPRSTVPREDLEALRAVNATFAEKFGQQTEAIKLLTEAIRLIGKNGAK